MGANGLTRTNLRRLQLQMRDSATRQSSRDLIPAPVISSSSPYNTDYLQLILASKVYDVVEPTPLTKAGYLSSQLECNVLLKREEVLPKSTYKLRGIYNKMAHMDDAERWRGVIACSTGNDALAVAFSARKLRMPSIIVLPLGAPAAKLQHLYRLGSTVVLHGPDLDAAMEECSRLQLLHELTYISACDDPYMIAGHGTIGPEILKQAFIHQVEAIFCPIVCGSLIAGIGIYVKRVAPHVKIIGVQSNYNDVIDTACLVAYKGQHKIEERRSSKHMSEEIVRICTEVVDDIVQVDTDEVLIATKEIYEDTRHILESTGAMSVAGLKSWVTSNGLFGSGMDFIAITSEANVDFLAIPGIVKRAAVAEEDLTVRVDALGRC
ncbi:threonine ammonia-lyase [Phlyctema vagabunda]|uniref:Threonine ammonia-lyase n=1 Tax=Phlyctema vagabunda TaxID=108571 RepID=A0ABR4PT14_9HELO